MKAFMTLSHGASSLGTLELELYDKSVPKTVQTISSLFQDGSYINSSFHRIIPNFMAQGGEIPGNELQFEDENFLYSHDKRGILSMANSGPNTNGTQFFITFRATPHLDGKHVVFGHVSPISLHVVNALECVSTGTNDVPNIPVVITHCGVYNSTEEDNEKVAASTEKALQEDSQEIQLDKEEEEEPVDIVEEEVVDDGKPKTKQQKLRERLRKLKVKANQARQLNRQEVIREGERLGSAEGVAKERKRLQKVDQKLRREEWELRNRRTLELAADYSVDGKALVEPAIDSIVRIL
jgi:cyclophilin family peptidyl-prolyl cis-trans isomerase